MHTWPLTPSLCRAPKPLSLHGLSEQGGPGIGHQPDRVTFFLESLPALEQKPNALLKLVKWNQISCWMDLVPFNQL